jgi:hypothetical protein
MCVLLKILFSETRLIQDIGLYCNYHTVIKFFHDKSTLYSFY